MAREGKHSMSSLVLEVIVQSVADARAAAAGGADRLEVVREIRLGGLTPSVSLVRAIAAETALPLRVMLRENGGYATDAKEIAAMRAAAVELAALRVDGLVTGFARDGEALLEDTAAVVQDVRGVRVTFHRAFDQVRDRLRTIDRLSAIPQVDRILTDGGPGSPSERCERLRAWGGGVRSITLIAGGGVDEEAIRWFARHACVREVHVGRAAREGGEQDGPVSVARVRRLRELADGTGSIAGVGGPAR